MATLAMPLQGRARRRSSARYLQTEAAWQEAGAPTAVVQLVADTETLMIDVAAHTGPPVAPPAGAANPLDNERAGI